MKNQIIRWKHVDYFFSKHMQNFSIIPQGKDKFIVGPKKIDKRQSVRIPHECCRVGNSEVTGPYLKLIEAEFDVTPSQILSAYPY